MRLKALEAFALSLPGATVSIQWGDDHVYKVGGKMFACAGGAGIGPGVSFKCSDLAYEMLIRRKMYEPAPYLARAKWVYLDDTRAVDAEELKAYLREAHRLVFDKLTKKAKAEIQAAKPLAPKKLPVKKSPGRQRRV